jgi:hypothetical protein
VVIESSRYGLSLASPLPLIPLISPPNHKVAIIAGNFELAELVKNHTETDVGEYLPLPRATLGFL